MNMNNWVEIVYFDGGDVQTFYGTVDDGIQEGILKKSPDEWVLLRNPRFLTNDGSQMELFEEDLVGTEPYFYLRSRSIVRVASIRANVTFWETGTAPRK